MTLWTLLFGDRGSIQAIVNYRMSVGEDQSFNFKGIQISGTLFHPKLSKWTRLSLLYPYVIFITVVSRAAIDQRIGREVNKCLFIKKNDRLDMESYRPVSL